MMTEKNMHGSVEEIKYLDLKKYIKPINAGFIICTLVGIALLEARI